MRYPLALKIAGMLLLVNVGVQVWSIRGFWHDLEEVRHEQQGELARWEAREHVGKVKIAAGSNTEFVPDPFRLEKIHQNLTSIKTCLVWSVLSILVSVGIVVGLFIFKSWRWGYWLSLGFVGVTGVWIYFAYLFYHLDELDIPGGGAGGDILFLAAGAVLYVILSPFGLLPVC